MLKLHGFAVSNYFNVVRRALEAKGLEYEVVKRYSSQDEDYLALSPMGKVPCLETERGTLTETIVILEYLDAAYPAHPLIPGDAFDRSKVLQVLHMLELYVELPARRLYPGVLFGLSNDSLTIEQVRPLLERGIGALKRLCRFEPFLLGEAETAADYMFMYSIDLAAEVAHKVYGWDLIADIQDGEALLERLNSHPVAQRLAAEKHEKMPEFLARFS